MQIQSSAQAVTLVLSASEAHLLQRALERASFIDTPVSEQAEIQEFCARAIDELAKAIR
jgi:flagellar motility protein MotE (MotC chaperone)